MLTYCDLVIHANDKKIEHLIDAVTEEVKKSHLWSRKEDKNNPVLGYDRIYAFERKKDNKFPGAGLSLFPKEPNESWYVPNVVPLEYGQLSYEEYNGVLKEFFDLYIEPASKELNLFAQITSGDVSAEDFLGTEAAKALDAFSDLANKSTGSSHPCDQKRWFSFICKACNFSNEIDVGLLERLLIEQGWPEEKAYNLIFEFEFARDFLRHIEKNS